MLTLKTYCKNHSYNQNIRCLRLARKMFTKLRFQSRSKTFWSRWLIKQYAIIVRSRLKTPTSGFIIISQLFLSIANALHGSLTLTFSIKKFGVYPISLLSDLCNVDCAIQVALLTTKYEYVQHKCTK